MPIRLDRAGRSAEPPRTSLAESSNEAGSPIVASTLTVRRAERRGRRGFLLEETMMVATRSIEESQAAARTSSNSLATEVGQWLSREGQLVVVLAVFAVVVLVRLDHVLFSDSWLALVSGREIPHHGLPGRDSLTVWTAGARWVDQQWLAQLVLYAVVRAGGIGLALLLHAAVVVGGLAAAAY